MALTSLARLGYGWVAIAIGAVSLATTPLAPWRALGALTFALLVGMVVRAIRDRAGRPVGSAEDGALRTMATTMLRVAVVVSALRLDWTSIVHAGVRPWLVAVLAISTGMVAFAVLARWLRLRGPVVALVAVGTSVCGAAAITAAAPRVNASDEDVTVSIAIISVLGAVMSIALIIAHAVLGITPETYGLVTGGSLHEVAHVVAAASAVPAAAGLALLTKLARVALLPIGLAFVTHIAGDTDRRGRARRHAVPGLAIAFFVASLIGSVPEWVPGLRPDIVAAWDALRATLLTAANAALAVSMAAIGLRMSPRLIARTDRRIVAAAAAVAVVLLAVVLLVARMVAVVPVLA